LTIISITSIVGVTGNAGQCNYAASKAGLIGMSKSMAQEVGARGITVNCVAPGFIATPMTDALNEQQKTAILGKIPAGAMGGPEDIAGAVVYLVPAADVVKLGKTPTIADAMYYSARRDVASPIVKQVPAQMKVIPLPMSLAARYNEHFQTYRKLMGGK